MNCAGLAAAINAYIAKADHDLSDGLKEAGFADAKGTVKAISELEENLARALKTETSLTLAGAAAAGSLDEFSEKTWPKLKRSSGLAKEAADAIRDEFEKVMPELVRHYSAEIDPALTVSRISSRTTAWAESWSEELGQLMQLNTHDEIEKLLADSLDAGKSVAEFTQALRDSGIRDEYYKARRVAVTEMLTAHSAAQQESFIQSPAVEGKLWRHTGSYRNAPRPNHVEMDGTVVKAYERFELRGADGDLYLPMYPRDETLPPGERINCHCLLQPVVDESILGLPLDERQRLQEQAVSEDDGAWEKELDAQNRAKSGIDETLYKPDETRYNEIYQDIQSNYNLGVNTDHQNRHIEGADGYIEGRSVLTGDAEKLLETYRGNGTLRFSASGKWTNKEAFTHSEVIGVWKSVDGSQSAETKRGLIHYSKRKGVHIVPARPEKGE
ncbi:MAG: hypothetical protein LBR72_08505 [Oscillospiraceae bacterium]|jgi:uncharacterized protein with gpF-like domain|nr:hypothetical protein [Oscillospiraceae bacterium]